MTERDPKAVFVVHGRNARLRTELFTFLRAVGLKPLEWSTAVERTGQASPYVGQVLTTAFDMAQAVVVLLTPDDVVYLDQSLAGPHDVAETMAQGQARPNVLFEAGMAMGRDESRTVLVEMGPQKSFSDIGGRHTLRLDNTPEKRQQLMQRLQTAGCDVDISGTDWLTVGDLTPPPAVGGGLPLGKRITGDTTPKLPRLTVKYDGRRSQMSPLVVTNRGPGDVYDLMVEVLDPDIARFMRPHHGVDLPVEHLPEGDSVPVLEHLPVLASPSMARFQVKVTARTESGEVIEITPYAGSY